MSLSAEVIERLKYAANETKLLTFGYIRSNSVLDVPLGIIQLCLAFLLNVDQWDCNNKGTHLKMSGVLNQIVENTNPLEEKSENYQSILGTLTLDSGKHHWKFRIAKIDLSKPSYARLAIGVIRINKLTKTQLNEIVETYMTKYGNVYAVILNNEDKEATVTDPDEGYDLGNYGVCCKDVGDIIDMYLDLDNYKMSYSINGKNYGDPFEPHSCEIAKDEYKMVMTLGQMGIAVELVSYQQVNEIPFE